MSLPLSRNVSRILYVIGAEDVNELFWYLYAHDAWCYKMFLDYYAHFRVYQQIRSSLTLQT